ncbi:MAG: hypothetical protein ACRDCH_03025, partial [Metamycoplasmataceae bacterium]
MIESKNLNIDSKTYELIKKDLIDEKKPYKKGYDGGSKMKAKFFVDIIVDNYYKNITVTKLEEIYSKKSGKWTGKSAHNQGVSWIKYWFKIKKPTKELIKKITSNYSELEFRNFLTIYFSSIIEKTNFVKKDKLLEEWKEYLDSLGNRNDALLYFYDIKLILN